jgi:hypothetical protein
MNEMTLNKEYLKSDSIIMIHNSSIIYLWRGANIKKDDKSFIDSIQKLNDYVGNNSFSIRKIKEGKEDDEFDLMFYQQE